MAPSLHTDGHGELQRPSRREANGNPVLQLLTSAPPARRHLSHQRYFVRGQHRGSAGGRRRRVERGTQGRRAGRLCRTASPPHATGVRSDADRPLWASSRRRSRAGALGPADRLGRGAVQHHGGGRYQQPRRRLVQGGRRASYVAYRGYRAPGHPRALSRFGPRRGLRTRIHCRVRQEGLPSASQRRRALVAVGELHRRRSAGIAARRRPSSIGLGDAASAAILVSHRNRGAARWD